MPAKPTPSQNRGKAKTDQQTGGINIFTNLGLDGETGANHRRKLKGGNQSVPKMCALRVHIIDSEARGICISGRPCANFLGQHPEVENEGAGGERVRSSMFTGLGPVLGKVYAFSCCSHALV